MGNFKTGGYCPNCLHATENCTCWEDLNKINIMDERLKDVNLIDEIRQTAEDLEIQLWDDEKRYGDTWKERGLVYNGMNQETRFFYKMQDYFQDFMNEGTPMPWSKILGEAHICLVRERKLKEVE